jgi:hypothetical protein
VLLPQREADVERLASEMGRLLADPSARTRMAEASRALGRPHAAHEVAADFLGLAGIGVREAAVPPTQPATRVRGPTALPRTA